MRILFIVPSYKPAYIYGGPIVVVALLAEQLVLAGNSVSVYTTAANGKTELDIPLEVPQVIDGVDVTYFKRNTKDHTHVSIKLWKHLNKTIHNYDIIHIHSWWNILVMGAVMICVNHGIRPILSPHGMFSKYILNANNSLTKKLIHAFIGKKLLANTWLHVSTALEWEESKAVIPQWKGEIIANPVKLPERTVERRGNSVFTIGFLSRIDPKKGLDMLIQALSFVKFDYILKIAGSGDTSYIKELKTLANTCGNIDKIEWVGWMSGEAKFDFLSQVDLFALTSHSENFAIVVIEALVSGTPVLISDQVGLFEYVKQNDFGWVTELKVPEITEMLEKAYIDTEKINRINVNVPSLIANDFSADILAKRYLEFYKKFSALKLSDSEQSTNE